MKKTLIVFTALIITTGAACATNTGNSTNTHANHTTTTQNTNTATANHNGMNHGSMNHNGMSHAAMQSAPNAASAPYDLQFIDTMIAHHQSAIDMANLAATNTNNAELKKFAVQISADQTREINQMKDWREKWYAGKPSALNMEMPGMADSMKMDMSKLNTAKDKNFDLAFIEMMIPHHEGAVTMSREAQQKAEHSEIKTLANEIIKAQESEIKLMQNWQGQWKDK